MRILSNQQTFGAKIVKHGKVFHYDASIGRYLPKKVYLVQINANSEHEVGAMAEAVKNWNPEKEFAERIMFDTVFKRDMDDRRFYILTQQKENLEKPDADKILGMVETSRVSGRTREVNYIQTHPEYVYQKGSTEYTGIGKAMMKSIQQQNKNRSLIAEIVSSAKGFYEKLGFRQIDSEHLIYKWKRAKH